jgi:hypothetical protein
MTDTAVRITSPGSAPSIQTPNGVKTMAIPIIPVTTRRSAARQAAGMTVKSDAIADSEKAAMATGRGHQRDGDRHEDERRAEAREAVDDAQQRRR